MKRIFAMIMAFAMIFILTMPLLAIAEEAITPDVPANDVADIVEPATDIGEPLTWAYLATIAGAAAFTLLIVQFCKVPLDKVWKIPTRVFAYVIALAIMLVATAFTTGLTMDSVLLTAANAFLAAMSAYGAYELTFAKASKPKDFPP